MSKNKRLPLHYQIIIGMVLGVVFGIIAVQFSWENFVINWIKPWGSLFIRGLKLIAVPLVLFSLISGVSAIKDLSSLSKIGVKTIGIYIVTTVLAVSIGLLSVNLFKPWQGVEKSEVNTLFAHAESSIESKTELAKEVANEGPLSILNDMVAQNILEAASDNGNMLQVIVFALLFGVSLVLIPKDKSSTVIGFFSGMNEVVLKMVHIIMYIAPLGTFALLAGIIVDFAGGGEGSVYSLLLIMGKYTLTVVVTLLSLAYVVYPILLYFFAGYPIRKFYKAIAPAQMLAFSTSSSAATLPLTMQCLEENIGVSKEVSGFVLPLGATINMDGTSCYQAIAAVFIANVLGYDLTLMEQLGIVLTATLASIGSAAVPGAGMVMLAIVLSHLGVPLEGIGLILGVDRILDMCRTVVNVTGDASVAVLIDSKLQKSGSVE
ncbi:MAG: Na+/H+-dicarboxylate symporter [Saprospiraceae bacterium]|jgi:Na+/H+-dicarboxylate symporter